MKHNGIGDNPRYLNLWIDDCRPAPAGYIWVKSVDEARAAITANHQFINRISLDHDAGDFYPNGGDYIRLLDWLEETAPDTAADFTFSIHSANPVGAANMRAIIEKNNWRLV